jgi:hypothetical protein
MKLKEDQLERKKQEKTNYSFVLKCLAGLTAAAVIAAGIIAAIATKVSAAVLTGIAAKTMLAAAALTTPIGPIIGAIFGGLAFVALVIALPLLLIDRNSSTATVSSGYFGGWGYTPSYRSTFYNPAPAYSYGSGTVHTHPGPSSNIHTHTHGHSSNIHTHGPSSSTTHTHGHSSHSHVHGHR